MTMKIRYGFFWAFVLIAMLLLASCGKEEQPQEVIIRPVRYVEIFSTGGTRTRPFSGVAQAGLESRLSFKVPGTVKKVPVRVGDRVRRGQLIASLDANDYRLQVQQAEAALTQAQAQARNARASYDRVRRLYENNNASKSQLDAARAANESADAGVRSAEKQVELAKLQLSYTRLTAPVGGAIASVHVEVNENVAAGQLVVMLTSGSQIEVKISVPEVLIALVKEGGKVNVTFDAIPDRAFAATITEVGVSSVGAGTTFPVTVLLDKRDPEIRPGMAATVTCRFESKDERDRFVLPSHAVVEDRDGRFVYGVEPILDEDGFGLIHRKSVTIGDLTENGLEIFEGLSDGDRVVTAGVSRIRDGQKVRL